MSSSLKQSESQKVAFDPHWQGILECATTEVFSMMAGANLTALSEAPSEPKGVLTAMVGLAGALCGMVTIRCGTVPAGKVAGMMLGEDAASNPAMIGDAMGELCNMVAGNFKSKINTLADHCMLSVPTVISGDDYVMQTAQPHQGVDSVLSYEGHPVWISLKIHP